MPENPILLCYDGSDSAKHALATAPKLLAGGVPAYVVAVWQPLNSVSTFAWAGGVPDMDLEVVDREAEKAAEKLAEEGAEVARSAGLEAQPIAVRSIGSIWDAIVQTADARDASVIVVGSRGL